MQIKSLYNGSYLFTMPSSDFKTAQLLHTSGEISQVVVECINNNYQFVSPLRSSVKTEGVKNNSRTE